MKGMEGGKTGRLAWRRKQKRIEMGPERNGA